MTRIVTLRVAVLPAWIRARLRGAFFTCSAQFALSLFEGNKVGLQAALVLPPETDAEG